MIIKQLHYSGAPKMFLWVANALASRGFDVTVLTYMKGADVKKNPDIKWIQLDLENAGIVSQYRAVRRTIRQIRPDVSISFLLDANVINILACLGTKTKSVVCERNDPFKPRYYKLKILKPLFCFAKGAVFQLPKVAEYYDNIKTPFAVIPNPVLCKSDVVVESFEKRNDEVVTLARLDIFQKRLDVLIESFALFRKKHSNYILTIYGDGPDKDELLQQIGKLGLDDFVRLGGITHSPQETIKDSKFFVLSSDFEGIPNGLIEAMSIGLPCISTDCRPGGAALLIKHSVNGLLVPPHDAAALAEQMCYLAEHPVEADAMGESAKKIVTDFAEDKIAQLWGDYISKVKEN